MANNYKIKVNPPQLTSEEIAKHKDFAGLLEKFYQPSKSSRVRRLIYLSSAAAAILVLLIFFTIQKNSSYSNQQENYFASQPFINTPFKAIAPVFASHSVTAEKGGNLTLSKSAKLTVPPNAFVGDRGETVRGEVAIKYRELHDFVDFFLSGIPMFYDSAGIRYNLESAGMVEVYAEQDGRKVFLHPEKRLNLEFISEINAPVFSVPAGFNIYKLDTDSRSWVFQKNHKLEFPTGDSPDRTPTLLNTNPELYLERKFQENLDALELKKSLQLDAIEASLRKPLPPQKPVRAGENDFVFDFEFEDENFDWNATLPEGTTTEADVQALKKEYRDVLWQLAPGNDHVSREKLASGNWTNLRIQHLGGRDFQLTLTGESETIRVTVNPVLSGPKYRESLAAFTEEFSRYEQKLAEHEARLEQKRAKLDQRIAAEKVKLENDFREKIEAYRQGGLDYLASKEIIRKKIINKFEVSSFGVWNVDKPIPPFLARVKGKFVNDNHQKFENRTAYLVDKTRNTVCRFLVQDGCTVEFNKDSDNLLWLVTENNKLAVFRPEDFEGIAEGETDFTFVMEVVDREIQTEEDVREILYF